MNRIRHPHLALGLAPLGEKKKRGRPICSSNGTVVKDRKQAGMTWSMISRLAQDGDDCWHLMLSTGVKS